MKYSWIAGQREQENATTMFVALWEYEVKPGCEEAFNPPMAPRATGSASFKAIRTSSRLVSSGTFPVLALFYFTLDYWDSESSCEQF